MIGVLIAATATMTATIDDIVAGRDVLPALEHVQDSAVQALAASGVAWGDRARLRALVPQVDVSVGTDADFDIRDALASTRTLVTTEGRAFGFQVRARWQFGDLVFNDAELAANRQALARAASERLVRDRVTQLYFERLELLLEERRSGSKVNVVRAARIEGLLNAYTGRALFGPNRGEPIR